MGPSNALLMQIAQGADPRMADAMAQGYRQGNAMLQLRQQQDTRNALAQAAPMIAQGNISGARQVLGQSGQFEHAYELLAAEQAAQAAAAAPLSAVGKLRSDFEAGRINADEYRSGMQALQSRVGGFMTVAPGSAVINRNTGEEVYRAPSKPKSISPSERRALREDQDSALNLDATIRRLDEALTLAPQSFEGTGAGLRGYAGTNLPDWMVPDNLANPQQAKATSELQKILNLEAVQAMAQNLKGATTNFELQEFQRILADPSAPNDIKIRTIQRMRQLAENQLELARQRIGEFEGNQAQQQPEPQQQQSDIGSGNTPDEQAAINAARAAIEQGRDPDLVRQRLEQHGIDPAVLD